MKNYPLFFSLRLGTDDGKIIAFGDVSPQKNNSVNKSINVNLYNATHYNIQRSPDLRFYGKPKSRSEHGDPSEI